MLNDRMPETLATLEREQMYVEVIFREMIDGEECLSWLSIQGETGESVHTSPHEIDRLHLEFWRECIDPSGGAVEGLPQVVMVPDAIAAAMGWPDPKAAAVAWRRQSTRQSMERAPSDDQADEWSE
jgi:hypothetical protein